MEKRLTGETGEKQTVNYKLSKYCGAKKRCSVSQESE